MAGDEWLKRQLEIDDAKEKRHDYERPLKTIKSRASMFKDQASLHGFVRGCVRSMLP